MLSTVLVSFQSHSWDSRCSSKNLCNVVILTVLHYISILVYKEKVQYLCQELSTLN